MNNVSREDGFMRLVTAECPFFVAIIPEKRKRVEELIKNLVILKDLSV